MKKVFYSGLFMLAMAACTCNNSENNSACTSNDSTTTEVAATESAASQIDGKDFILTELNGTELASNTENPSHILFSAEEKIASASVGCNTINAKYNEGENGTVAFENGLSTKMACPEGSREDEFVAAFNQVARYEINENIITFFNAEGVALFRGKIAE